jgi:phosphopantetheinyl transferase
MRHVSAFRLVDDDGDVSALLDCLGAEDRARCATFTHPRRQREFLLGRALLLHAVRARHGHGLDWQIGRSPHGRPFAHATGADGAAYTIDALSLAHARGVLLCVCGDGGRIGCDVEVATARVATSAARVHADRPHPVFAAGERAWIAAGGAGRDLRFLLLWAAKEALAKAAGMSVFAMAGWPAEAATLPPDGIETEGCVLGFGARGHGDDRGRDGRPAHVVHARVLRPLPAPVRAGHEGAWDDAAVGDRVGTIEVWAVALAADAGTAAAAGGSAVAGGIALTGARGAAIAFSVTALTRQALLAALLPASGAAG